MKRVLLTTAVVLLAACSKAPEPPAVAAGGAADAAAGIQWIRPRTVADVDRAFEQAQARNQPVFLFWTAVWCPPCNQVKSTIFTRTEFIEKSRSFVPVYVDADSPSGQVLGERFRVRGYPTMVLLDGAGEERMRLAGSVDAARYMQLLDRGLAGGHSARQALDAALAGQPLSADDWRMLAFYSWETDDGGLVPEKDVPATLLKLAAACPPAERDASSRLVLEALHAASQADEPRPAVDRGDAIASVASLLAQPELVRANHDLLGYGAADIVGWLTAPGTKERTQLAARWGGALDALAADARLSNSGRMYAMLGKVGLARLDAKDAPLPSALLDEVKAQASRVDREVTDLDERQAVITLTGAVLARAGLLDESDALLEAELARSHSPYYYMSQLASNGRRRGTPEGRAAAIEWSRRAYDSATGAATRLRWGGGHVNTLIELAPQDAGAIEEAAGRVLAEVKPETVALTGNNRAALDRLSRRLVAWNKDRRHDAALARLAAQLKDKCGTPATADRAWCESLFVPDRRG